MQVIKRPRVGDRMFAVEWCDGVPTDENGDAVMDAADDRVKRFATIEDAREFAMRILLKYFFGSVSITPVEFVAYDEDDALRFPHAGFWEAAGETEHIEA